MPEEEKQPDGLPPGSAVAVFVVVIVAIAIILISQRIPHAQRPTIQEAPVTTVVTLTTTPTP